MFAEVLDHHLDLLRDVVRVEPHPAHDLLHGGAALDLLVVGFFPLVGELEGERVGRVVLQHVENELLLDGLTHRIHVEGRGDVVGRWLARRVRPGAEQLHRLGLRRGGEGDEGDAGVISACSHLRSQQVLGADLSTITQLGELFG